MSSSDRIARILSNEVYLQTAIECLKRTKTVKQISEAIGYKVVNVAQWIMALEKEGVIMFTEKGWKITEEATEVIEKYLHETDLKVDEQFPTLSPEL